MKILIATALAFSFLAASHAEETLTEKTQVIGNDMARTGKKGNEPNRRSPLRKTNW